MFARLSPRRTIVGLALALGSHAGAVSAQTAPAPAARSVAATMRVAPPADSGHATRDRYLLITASAIGSATFTQATAMPAPWPRTWRGYGARLSDQAGFAVAEEGLRLLLLKALPWKGSARPCKGAGVGRPLLARAGVAARCAVLQTLVVHNAEGARRPNVPFLGAVIGGSALSLAWRPERSDASKGRAFVLTRISLVTGGSIAKGAFTTLTTPPARNR